MKFVFLMVLFFSQVSFADSYVDICKSGDVANIIADYYGTDCAHMPKSISSVEWLVLDGLGKDFSINTIPAGAFSEFPSLKVLVIRDIPINEVQDGAFSGVKLRELELEDFVERFAENAFEGLSSLEELDFRTCDFPAKNFEHIPAIKKLTVIEKCALSAKNFKLLTTLEELRLTTPELRDGHLSDLTALKILYVGFYNKAKTAQLPKGVFTGLSNLESLSLGANKIEVGEFVDLPKLRSLDIRDSKIKTLVFKNLPSLTSLTIERNHLPEIQDGTFADLAGLTDLNLKENGIRKIGPGTFTGLNSLEGLSVDYNKIKEIPPGTFKHTPLLGGVTMNGNLLTELPIDALSDLSNILYALHIAGNKISVLPVGAFDKMPLLEYLVLGANTFTEIPVGAFRGLSNLNYLYLIETDIKPLPKGVFSDLTSLRELSLTSRQFDSISKSYLGLSADVEVSGVEVLP